MTTCGRRRPLRLTAGARPALGDPRGRAPPPCPAVPRHLLSLRVRRAHSAAGRRSMRVHPHAPRGRKPHGRKPLGLARPLPRGRERHLCLELAVEAAASAGPSRQANLLAFASPGARLASGGPARCRGRRTRRRSASGLWRPPRRGRKPTLTPCSTFGGAGCPGRCRISRGTPWPSRVATAPSSSSCGGAAWPPSAATLPAASARTSRAWSCERCGACPSTAPLTTAGR
mmetsp:Transcript_51217/g.155748  ORF Transcript_51217/g.155748 Transcript_51217/m.155748 type:complete len:229 (-) Transcript_51217:331-1017(-)